MNHKFASKTYLFYPHALMQRNPCCGCCGCAPDCIPCSAPYAVCGSAPYAFCGGAPYAFGGGAPYAFGGGAPYARGKSIELSRGNERPEGDEPKALIGERARTDAPLGGTETILCRCSDHESSRCFDILPSMLWAAAVAAAVAVAVDSVAAAAVVRAAMAVTVADLFICSFCSRASGSYPGW